MQDNRSYGTDENYRAIWARDGAMTVIWTLGAEEEHICDCQKSTLITLLDHQSSAGQIPCYVGIDNNEPEYAGVGGISSIDAGLWVMIALWHYSRITGDWSMVEERGGQLQRTMDWLGAHDSNNCGLLEIPEAGDWTDLFARSYHVLYDEVLWYRALVCYGRILRHIGPDEKAEEYEALAERVRRRITRTFWPSTAAATDEGLPNFNEVQFGMGDTRYLVAQVSPFSFSWRCDVYANLLAYLMDLIGYERAMMTFRFIWGVGANEPGPIKNLYPPVYAGDPEWREYFTVNLLNLPDHYHNGGIWPFVGGLWVRYIHKLGMTALARRELVKLTTLCSEGVAQDWEFNEWHHAKTGRPMGKAFQAWTAASYVKACHDLHLDPDSIGAEA